MAATLPAVATEALRAALEQVLDPELGLNIVELGLVRALRVTPGAVVILLTMTSAACPMAELIVDDVNDTLQPLLPPDTTLDIQLHWEPPWTPAAMSEAARQRLRWQAG